MSPALPLVSTIPADVDLIVVGAGSAGCVAAVRLAETGRQVLLLESGPAPSDPDLSVPGLANGLVGGDLVWPAPTTPQAAAGGRVVPLVSGRVLGGGSSVNALGWFHAHPGDFDRWQAAGAVGWDAHVMQELYRRVEDHELGDSVWHGASGPVPVSGPRFLHPVAMPLMRAAQELGWPLNHDLNGAQRTGVSLAYSNVRDGRRVGVVDAYLAADGGRFRPAVSTDTHVTALLVDGERVVGVEARVGGEVRHIAARHGVVLAAGALRTPQLLMLSGIGPGEQLREHDIDVVRDLPAVGVGLQDHPAVPVPFRVEGVHALHGPAVDDYTLARRGPLSTLGQTVAVVAAGNRATDPAAEPELFFGLALLGADAGQDDLDVPTGLIIVGLIDPDSRGTVRLASADPADSPLVDPAYLSEQHDRERLREGVAMAGRLLDAGALQGFASPLVELAGADQAVIDDHIDASLSTYYHPVGTARIGTGPESVVDPQLRVHGLQGLWVVDASVMPRITRALPHATVIAVAERAAELINDALDNDKGE